MQTDECYFGPITTRQKSNEVFKLQLGQNCVLENVLDLPTFL